MYAVQNMQSVPVIVTFTDYSRWQRRPNKAPGAGVGGKGGGGGGLVVAKQPRSRHYCSPERSPRSSLMAPTTCAQSGFARAHGHVKIPSVAEFRVSTRPMARAAPSQASPDRKSVRAARAVQTPQYKLLKMQVEAKRKSVREFQSLKEALTTANLKLINSIRQRESEINSDVKDLFQRYQKFKGALATLRERVDRAKEYKRVDLEKEREEIRSKTKSLEQDVHKAETDLQRIQREREVLRGYKEKEYVVNQVKIEQLREEIKLFSDECEEIIEVLEIELMEESEKHQRAMESKRREIEAEVTEVYIMRIQRSVQEKAVQNKIMQKEITMHHHKIKDLKRTIEELNTMISEVKVAVQEERRRQNPLLGMGKCLPDTELQLDIPVHKSLPL